MDHAEYFLMISNALQAGRVLTDQDLEMKDGIASDKIEEVEAPGEQWQLGK